MIQTETTPPVQKDDTDAHDEVNEIESFRLLLMELWMEQNEQH